MINHLLHKTGLLLFCLLLSAVAWSQQFKNGIRTGQIKVKFAQEMTSTLNKVTVTARTNGFTTGIANVDAVAQSTKAKNMYRLFPYDAKHEAKLRKHGLHLWYVVEVDEGTDPAAAVAAFQQLKEVAKAEVEREKKLAPYSVKPYEPGVTTSSTLPFNDPLLKDQWHYENTGQAGVGDADVNLFSAWQTTTGANNIIVSVHDEGVDVDHADLKSNIWVNLAELNGQPGVDDDGNGFKDDINGYNFDKNKGAIDAQYHGTHVAGTIAAVNNNGVGVSGVAGGNGTGNGVKIMSLQIMGGGSIEKSFVYAANNGAVISQNSWGYSYPGAVEESVLEAIDYFVDEAGDYEGSPMRGGIVFFASGNYDSDSEWYPGYYDKTFAVAAIGPEWKRAYYSNYGAWVEISAPGGDQEYGLKGGVLSTIPNDQYAYLQGTSMACPHVSGIAALALANRTKQLTNAELWNKLATGVVAIDEINPDYIGKLGSGAIDASLAIKNDQGKAPGAITDLAVNAIAQEFAQFSWSVPADEDDGKPISFTLYYHTQPITTANLLAASKVSISNAAAAGSIVNYELVGLLGLTTYHFAITATDRWGNASALSNILSATTNEGPSIAVDENSQAIDITIDAANATTTSADITILNQAAGLLRWNHFMRHKNTALSFNSASLHYPVSGSSSTKEVSIGRLSTQQQLKSDKNSIITSAFTPIEKELSSWPTNIIGETDLTLTNSAAARFYVSEPDGFNLTQVRMYLKHDPAKGPVIVEIFKGSAPTKDNLVYAQEYSSWGASETWAYVTLNEQLYFESGSTFWVAFHVPAGNLFPLGIGWENETSSSSNCFISFNVGTTWMPLEEAIASTDFAWSMVAVSGNAYLGNYLTLEPGSGDVNGFEQTTTTLTANAATLINGTYQANVVLTSNDAAQRELRIPVSVTVSGHTPSLSHIDIADFGAVFVGTKKTLEIEIDNQGYGNFNNPSFYTNTPQFVIEGWAPWQIPAREKVVLQVSYNPTTAGNSNDVLTITNGDQTYQVALFGVGAETSKIAVTPLTQTISNVTIGDEVSAQLTVENNGAFPLKYFIPGFDTKGVSNNWPTDYHTYGYKYRTSNDADPISYQFQDIKATGVEITGQLKNDTYYELDMGFTFPFYSEAMQKIYIAQKGFTVFDNSVRPINAPSIPGNEWTPSGYISVIGTHLNYVGQGGIYYQKEADRVIIQYDNVTDGYSGSITAQMVLFANGDIRFYYDNNTMPSEYFSVLIEDMAKQDGILICNYNKVIDIYGGLAIGLDYPGPGIITSIENGSGVVMPGSTAVVNVNLSTATLVEGTTNRYLNFISNDPSQPQTSALIQIEITGGGVAQPQVSLDTIAFGNVFQGAAKSSVVTIKNPGTANVDIASITWVNDQFQLSGDQPTLIKPGLYKNYTITIPTAVTTPPLEDWLSINYADGSYDTIYVTGRVVDPPAIAVDLSLLQETLNFGDVSTHPITIENTGLANLEVVATGKQWLSFSTLSAPADFSYTVEKNNDGSMYQWIDIRETGTQLPFIDWNNFDGTFYRDLTLPFPIEFYGVTYTAMKIGDNGIISFEENPQPSFFTDYIPSATHEGPCIMPYWTFSGFSDYLYPIEDIGIFYQAYDDKFIITWSYFTNNFGGMGDPVSAQVIFYKNGSMKFQYKAEEGGADLTSHFGTIGLQKDATNGIAISEYLPLDYGTGGLAYIITPANKYVVAPGTTLSGEIKFDATNIYGGVYNADLKIETNVPNMEQLSKPVELTVTGDAVFEAVPSVDFGTKMVVFEGWSPAAHMVESFISNEGSAPLEITWIAMADGSQNLSLQVWALVDGWFGPEWRWADISELYSPWAWQTPVFTIKPGEMLKARAVFAPAYAGSFTDDVVFTTSLGEQRITLQGVGIDPPAMVVDESPISVSMNEATEVSNHSITISNENGQSDLNYAVSIDFGRAETSRTEAMATTTSIPASVLVSKAASTTSVEAGEVTYNRTIKHTDRETPDTHVGIGGAFTFSVATKFNAGAEGFNLSHVEAWFRTETLSQGTVNVEVRAGGSGIASSTKVGEGKLDFTSADNDGSGTWHTLTLDEPVGMYPNEDFYVLVTYPLGIEFPQGTLTDQPATPGRYYYFSEGTWYDVQNASGFETAGWLMYAGEETAGNTTWLSITSATAGTIAAGNIGTIEIKMEGAYAKRGDQVAKIMVTSNDPNNSTDEVEVTLHMNEAPLFTNVPEATLVAEGEEVTIEIPVTDKEGHTITVQAAQVYAGVTHSFENGLLTITLAPEFGAADNYVYSFTATDEFNAAATLTLPVEVAHTNRVPVYIGSPDPMEYTASGELVQYNIDDFFEDPDGDEYSFTIATANSNVIQVFSSATEFLVKPIAMGSTTISFTVTDSYGATTTHAIEVEVVPVLGIEDHDVKFSISVYPNPTAGKVSVEVRGEIDNQFTVRVFNNMGITLLKSEHSTAFNTALDLSHLPTGIYFVEIKDRTGKSIRRIIKD